MSRKAFQVILESSDEEEEPEQPRYTRKTAVKSPVSPDLLELPIYTPKPKNYYEKEEEKDNSEEDNENIVHKYGRKPYDPTKPRDPLYELPRHEIEIMAKGSLQQIINAGPNGTVVPKRYTRYKSLLINKGFIKINAVRDLLKMSKGSRVCYLSTELKWRSGGFLVEVSKSKTLYNSDEKLENNKYYFSYKAFNNALFHVQEEDIRELFVKPKKIKQRNTGPVPVSVPREKTAFPVTIRNTVIKYCRDNNDRNRFMSSLKYQRIITDGYVFQNDSDSESETEFGSDVLLLDEE